MDQGFPAICAHVQRAGSAVAAALQECDSVVPTRSDPGRDLAAIRRNLLEAARLLDRAERLAYPVDPDETP